MKIAASIIILIGITAVVAFFGLGFISKSGKPNGLSDKRLTPCGTRPNCVSSEPKTTDSHFIEPIKLPTDFTNHTVDKLKKILQSMGGTVIEEQEIYLAATFTSKIFGFTDDFELRVDLPNRLIHVRSASRVGYSDGGVNRKRIETLKQLMPSK